MTGVRSLRMLLFEDEASAAGADREGDREARDETEDDRFVIAREDLEDRDSQTGESQEENGEKLTLFYGHSELLSEGYLMLF